MLEISSTDHYSPPMWPANDTIRVLGHVDQCWSEWLDGLAITHLENGRSLLHGAIVDRAALHSMLTKICNLNLEIVTAARGDHREEVE
jgi:hypothetical protein